MADNGAAGSVEIRVPVWRKEDKTAFVELAGFSDAGYAWNRHGETVGPNILLSAGAGARIGLAKNLLLQFYWGHRFKKMPDPAEHDIQDAGIHFSLSSTFR